MHLPFKHVIVNEGRHDGDSYAVTGSIYDLSDLFVLKPDNVLSVDFEQLMLSEQSVAGCRRVLDQVRDLAGLELKADRARAVLEQG